MKLRSLPKETKCQGQVITKTYEFRSSTSEFSNTKKSKLRKPVYNSSKPINLPPSSSLTSNYNKSKRYALFLKEQVIKNSPSAPPKLILKEKTIPESLILQKANSSIYKPRPSINSAEAKIKKNKSEEFSKTPEEEFNETMRKYTVMECPEKSVFALEFFNHPDIISSSTRARLENELYIMRTSLPCSMNESIFVMYSSADVRKMRVLISGKKDTVFADGLFLFDVLISNNYPDEPPNIVFRTTQNTYFQFHPDLDKQGNVNIPMLHKSVTGQIWNNKSSLAELFIHLQCNIMNNNFKSKNPIFEKYENDHLTNMLLQYEVKYATLTYAIIKMIKCNPSGFKEAIIDYFSLKAKDLIKRSLNYIQEASEFQVPSNPQSLNPTVFSLLKSDPIKVFKKLSIQLTNLLDETFKFNSKLI